MGKRPEADNDQAGGRRIGILGGTFDPIHYAHLMMAEEARNAFALDQVIFIPNGTPAIEKPHEVSDAEDRVAMCALAIEGNAHFSLSRVEVDRAGPSYAIDTVRRIRADNPGVERLYFITGADAVLGILAWRDYKQLLQECEFIACTRPGFPLANLREMMPAHLTEHVHFHPLPGLEISSTELRRRVAEGHGIRYLTPDSVDAYIREHGLYR